MAVTYASNNFTVTQNAAQNGTGTVTAAPTTVTIGGIAQGAALFTGAGTSFTTQLRVGSLVIAGGSTYCVHSIASATSMIAYKQNHADGTGTISTASTFTYYVPTLWSELVTAVQGQAATIASTDGKLNITFTTSSLTINDNALLVCDSYSVMSFGAASAYRLNLATNGYLMMRNGGSLTYNGNVQHSFFNGWLNVLNGTFTYQLNSPGGTSRQDNFSGNTKSNGVSNLELIYSGGTATAWSIYTHFEGLSNKLGGLKIINNTQAVSTSANGITIQFGGGTYNAVTFPARVSTFGITQVLNVSLARSGGNSRLVKPVFPEETMYLSGDALGAGGTAELVDETWSSLPAGTLGTLVKTFTPVTIISRKFTWFPGTYATEGGWNVYLRDSQATPKSYQLGVVNSSAGIELTWATFNLGTNAQTTYTPFKLLARKAGFVTKDETFTSTSPRTEAFIPAPDAAYVSDQSALTGIAYSTATGTFTDSGTIYAGPFYDWWRWRVSQNDFMTAVLADPVGYSGKALTIAGKNFTINTGASFLQDDRFNELRVTNGGIVTNNGTIDFPYSDVNGNRATVTNTNPQGFAVTGYLRFKKTTDTTWTTTSYTGNSVQILVELAEYDVQVRCPGYDWKTTTLDTNASLSLDLALQYHQAADGTPQYTEAFDAALEAVFSYDATAQSVKTTNTGSSIMSPGFNEMYRATQRIMHLSGLVWTWANPIKANSTSQKIIIPTGNPITMFLSADSTASVKLTCPVIHKADGSSADDRVKGNAAGFSIILGSPATAESAGLVSQIVSQLGGASYDEATQSQAAIRTLVADVQALVDAVKAKTDNLPAAPAAVGDAMTLTTDYNAAKTASSQASVDALGAPLQASDYVAPANSDIAAIKTKVDTLENADLSGVATAAQVTALGTPLQAADYVAPANSDIASIKATVEAIEPVDVSGLATASQVTALGTPLQAGDYTAAPTATDVAGAVRTELATELGRIDATVSSRLATTGYTAPDNTTIGQIKTKVDTLENTDVSGLPTLADIEGSTVLAKEATVATRASQDSVDALGKPMQAADYVAPPTATELLDAGLAKEATAQAALEAAEFAGNVAA